METAKLKKFSQFARRSLIEQTSAKLSMVLAEGSAARRESRETIEQLEDVIKQEGKDHVIERVAYTWFNRFSALRFMDVNRYTRIGVISPAEGQFQPEILAEAKMGHIDEEMVPEKIREQIFALLDGNSPSRDPQGEAYRLLLVAVCNKWQQTMPFLFESINDYTELLLPDDLLSGNSILAYTREAMTPDACQDVEVIGWLYQFYISEKKDEVFEALKKNKKKITPENIPAATQLFTPRWIVRYLVENSLGRLWMLNRPESKLVERMEYYIQPQQPETDFLCITKPEEIKICDPACGSGHMLFYAFDLLYAIYEEEGYQPADIPEKILTHNLYGIEIDERAGSLASFALIIKAREKYRRFLSKSVRPNICVLKNIKFREDELENYIDFIGQDLFTEPLLTTLYQFEESNNFGSLIQPKAANVSEVLEKLEKKDVFSQLFLTSTHQKVLQVLRQVDYLDQKYYVVIANPPYMGGKGMNSQLSTWVKENYPDSKSDLFAAFIERNIKLAKRQGFIAMITMQSWMFLSSFENLRGRILGQETILSMAHLGARAFDSIGGEVVSTTAFILENSNHINYKGSYLRLVDGNSEAEKESAMCKAVKKTDLNCSFLASAADFRKIPGSPVAYWVSENMYNIFSLYPPIGDFVSPMQGLTTTDNNRFIREWSEVSSSRIGFSLSKSEAKKSDFKWFPINKGGSFRKWFGNDTNIVNYQHDGQELKDVIIEKYRDASYAKDFSKDKWDKLIEVWVMKNQHSYFRRGITWSKVTSGDFSVRNSPEGFIFTDAGSKVFCEDSDFYLLAGYLNSSLVNSLLKILSPTLNFEQGTIKSLPFIPKNQINQDSVNSIVSRLEKLSEKDWNSFEISWDFNKTPLLCMEHQHSELKATYNDLNTQWLRMTVEMQHLEKENNRIFIEAYGLQDELTPEVSLNEITLTCNPHYRYDHTKPEAELEALLLADTMKEFISYAVGCMFGRYSLDKPGLILANQGETITDYLQQIPTPTFPPDEDNVIPILDGDWFIDDISDRFNKFLRTTFGDDHYAENLKFIETAIGKDIRKYFLKDFYSDHVKRYKKRPIYWLFSSPKGSFNALIYMHRYRPDTVSIVLNDYLREFRNKLEARMQHLQRLEISANSSPSEKTKAIKEISKLATSLEELNDYERDVLYPLAIQQIPIDLDDGVKINYQKFGAALKTIPGLQAKEE
jgi:type II restriction/modification system DNA methylase subunit YeeA